MLKTFSWCEVAVKKKKKSWGKKKKKKNYPKRDSNPQIGTAWEILTLNPRSDHLDSGIVVPFVF